MHTRVPTHQALPPWCDPPHFPDDDTEGQSGRDTCLRPHSSGNGRARIGTQTCRALKSLLLQHGTGWQWGGRNRNPGLPAWSGRPQGARQMALIHHQGKISFLRNADASPPRGGPAGGPGHDQSWVPLALGGSGLGTPDQKLRDKPPGAGFCHFLRATRSNHTTCGGPCIPLGPNLDLISPGQLSWAPQSGGSSKTQT